MPVSKNKTTGKWESYFRYYDSSGNLIPKHKRGFKTRKEALDWEREFILVKSSDLNMSFKSFLDLYIEDYMIRNKASSFKTFRYSLNKFEDFYNFKMSDITPKIIRNWQNKLLKENYSNAYLVGIQKKLCAVFNYAVKVHGLKENPFSRIGIVKNFNSIEEKGIWTIKEFQEFTSSFKENNIFYISLFNLLFYSGARVGEVLALTIQDIDFNQNIIKINKTITRINREDVVTIPKTLSSIREVDIPKKVMELVKKHIDTLYDINKNSRIYPVTREIVRRTMMNHISKCNIKKIRIHDLRHSHVSLLLNMGINIFEVSKRIGHADASITSKVYAHIYKESGRKIAELLNATKMQPL